MKMPEQRIVAIHQPNFFPWLGYFDKIRQADVFIFLDDVAYPKSGSGTGSWCNRVKFNIQGVPRWVGGPIRREPGVQILQTVQFDENQPWRSKFMKSLQMNYAKSPYFKTMMPWLEELVMFNTENLTAFNINAIRSICGRLGIGAEFVKQSDLISTRTSTELLIELIRQVSGTAYLCGGGASAYQEDALFGAANLELVYQNFSPESYCDEKRFIPGLSVIDFLMHAEPELYPRLGQPLDRNLICKVTK